MKEKVEFSAYSFVLSAVILLLLIAISVFCYCKGEPLACIVLLAVVVLWCAACLWYAPLAISVDDSRIEVHRSLCIKKIPLADVECVELCPPTMAERRICGSGGFFGYWGWFTEKPQGKYFAYYGKASDCFLVRLKSGRQYMLGCRKAPVVVDYIKARI